jgi:hypothetical protein
MLLGNPPRSPPTGGSAADVAVVDPLGSATVSTSAVDPMGVDAAGSRIDHPLLVPAVARQSFTHDTPHTSPHQHPRSHTPHINARPDSRGVWAGRR